MRVYISGKITGDKGYMEHFLRAEDWLLKQGYEPINPARVNRQLPAGTTYAEYMRMALAMLEMCDAVYTLDNWKDSAGAQAEYHYAIALKKIVMYEHGESKGHEKFRHKDQKEIQEAKEREGERGELKAKAHL